MTERAWSQAVVGAALVAGGLLLLGSQAGWYDFGAITRLWPLWLVVVGVRRGPTTRDGFLWLGWGAVLLMWTTGAWSLNRSWPLLLVLHGVAIVCWPGGVARRRRDGSRVG